jgi:hypothetical protein
MKKSAFEKAYMGQIRAMQAAGRAWVKSHPKAAPMVQFNYPQNIGVIGTLAEALEKGIVSANEDGRELLRAMGAFEDIPTQPTVIMCRVALDVFEMVPVTYAFGRGDEKPGRPIPPNLRR